MKYILIAMLFMAGCNPFTSFVHYDDRLNEENFRRYNDSKNGHYYMYIDPDSIQLRQRIDNGFIIKETVERDF